MADRKKMVGQIFINYRRDDSSGAAGRLFDILSSRFASNQIFMDVDNLDAGIGCNLAAKQAQRKEFFIVGVDGSPDIVAFLKDSAA